AALEELIRAQNGFHARFIHGQESPERYRLVTQLLRDESLERVDIGALRGRVKAFSALLDDPLTRIEDLDATSHAIVADAQQIIAARKEEIARQLPQLERETSALMSSGLAVAWILMLLSFAAVQITLRKVVQPIEELSAAADRVAAGDLSARAPVAGDHEIATLGIAFNHMADELKARARTDDLTALPNFRAFRERIDAELDRADRYPSRFGVLVLDLDRFKKYNDTYGHSAGNDALRRVAQSIRETVRAVDFPARYGGEEFAVIVPQIEPVALTAIAERIRANIEALPAPSDGSTVTVSIGAAIYPDDARERDALFQSADARLYEAKKAGRNRVVSRAASSIKAGAVALLLMFVAFQASAKIVVESKSATTTTGEVVRFELGTLFVPENREKADSRTIGVGFARIPATHKGGTPVFILPGGPGESSLGMFTDTDAAAQRRLASLIRNFGGVGDIVVFDQRGYSERGDKLEFPVPHRPLDAPRSLSDEAAAYIKAAREAIVTHRDKDLSGYTVIQCAADVNDLRRELGYEKIILIGQSFGSQWSFAIMRLYPKLVARALLSGVEPLDSAYDMPSGVFAALESIAKDADNDSRLKPWLPKGGVMAALHDVRKRLAEKPLQAKVGDGTIVLGL
ncbi:MAG TPA: alpha/beta fold hydrolase, partial [Thermoanaerobaculia bacterium]|nr:alpha/beta fold hydrolase [Thermoanaerobaculia bacterium]